MIVDSHCHVSPLWFEPVEMLLFQMDRCGVEKALLVQLLGQYDNSYQQACVRQYPDRLASIVAVDPEAADAPLQLKALADEGIGGVRLRPPGRAGLEDALIAVWAAAASCGLPVSCIGTAEDFCRPAFGELVMAFPHMPIVMEHLAGLARPDFDGHASTRLALLRLAQYPNLFVKVPGLGQLARRRPMLNTSDGALDREAAMEPIRAMIGAFGARRLMWGSDFPPVASREGYENALQGVRQALLADGTDAGLVLGRTAQSVFQI